MRRRKRKSMATLISIALITLGVTPSFAAPEPTSGASYPILHFIDSSGETKLVMIEGGRTQGIVDNTVFEAQRQTETVVDGQVHHMWIETGRLKAIRVDRNYTLAVVTQEESQLSRAFFPKFPGVMAGDKVSEVKISVARTQAVVPVLSATYQELFEDPKALPTTFELSAEGKNKIRAMAAVFGTTRLSLLMVEGYTDENGPEDANQVESYQRALTVRQFLVEELNFDPKRVVAVGYGESDPIGAGFIAGYRDANRRVSLKAKALKGE